MTSKNLNSSVLFHIISLSENWKKDGDIIAQQYGITTQQWIILSMLSYDPNLPFFEVSKSNPKPVILAKDLADMLHVSRANITNLLNVLVDKDLVTQTMDRQDKRRKYLELTEKGNKLMTTMESVRKPINNKIFSQFSKKELEDVVVFAKKCLEVSRADGLDMGD